MNDSVLLGRAEEILEKEAHDSLMEKLRSGEEVGKFNRRDLLESELGGIPGWDRLALHGRERGDQPRADGEYRRDADQGRGGGQDLP